MLPYRMECQVPHSVTITIVMTHSLNHLHQRAMFTMGPDWVVHTQDDLMVQWVDNFITNDKELDMALSEGVQGVNYSHDFNSNLSEEAL